MSCFKVGNLKLKFKYNSTLLHRFVLCRVTINKIKESLHVLKSLNDNKKCMDIQTDYSTSLIKLYRKKYKLYIWSKS